MDYAGSQSNTFISTVFRHAEECGDRLAVVFQPHGDADAQMLRYDELRTRVVGRAEFLRDRGLSGKPAALLFPPGVEFVVDFLACLAAGVVAVPLNLSRNARQFERFVDVLSDSKAGTVLTTETTRQSMWHFVAESGSDLSLLDWF